MRQVQKKTQGRQRDKRKTKREVRLYRKTAKQELSWRVCAGHLGKDHERRNHSLIFLVSLYGEKYVSSGLKKKNHSGLGWALCYFLGFGFAKRKATPLRNPTHKRQLLKPRFSKAEPIKML